MAVYLPKSMQFSEYKPSMVGIPTQSLARMYDRLDKEALRTEAAANKVQTTLANHIAVANEGDKPYLNDLLGKVDGIIEQASSEGNLPGYSKQIRKLVGDISASPEYATVRNNARLAEEYRKTEMTLTTQHGRENVIGSGDNPANFSTFGPDGELRQFQGFASKRPDYLKGMDDVYIANKDIVANEQNLDAFIASGEAFANYTKTPEGRVHINEIAQSMAGVPFNRLTDESQAVQVMETLNAQLKDAGVRYLKSNATTDADRYKHLQGKGIVSSGIANTSLTDGTDKTDQTIAVFDDRVKGTQLDDQLTAFVSSDPMVQLYPDASGGTESFERGQGIQTDQIISSKLTSGIGPNGRPLIQVEYNEQAGKDGEQGIGYYEISQEDLTFLPEVVAGETLYQLRNLSTSATQGSMAPAIANIYDSDFNKWATGDGSVDHKSDIAGLSVKKTAEGFAMYDTDGNPMMKGDKPLVYRHMNDVRNHIGFAIINK